MRTTLTLDPDVAARLASLQQERGLSFKQAVNETLRRGLNDGSDRETPTEPYRMPTRSLGLKPGIDIDKIRNVLGDLDDEAFIEANRLA